MRRGLLVMAGVVLVALLVWLVCFAPKPRGPAMLGKRWHEQVYGLNDDEVLRLIPPPFDAQRMQIMARGYYKNPMPGVMGQLSFYTDRGPMQPFGVLSTIGTLDKAVQWTTIGHQCQVEETLAKLTVDGDWFVREERPVERRIERRM